jgi:flagellar motor switch protein FliN
MADETPQSEPIEDSGTPPDTPPISSADVPDPIVPDEAAPDPTASDPVASERMAPDAAAAEPIVADAPPPEPVVPDAVPTEPFASDSNLIDPAELAALVAQAPALDVDLSGSKRRREPKPAAEPELDMDDPIALAMAEAIAAECGASAAPPAAVSAPSPAPNEAAVIGATTVAASAAAAREYTVPQLDTVAAANATGIDMLDDVQLDVKIELGRTTMYIEDVLKLGTGSVVELDKLAGDPVDIYVNERLIARGEVLVLNDNFCVRINAIDSSIPDSQGS